MYAWIFRHLPGPKWFRIFLSVCLLALALLLVVTFVFPWLSELTRFTDSTIGTATPR